MAMIRLSDVFIPSVYLSYTALNSPETSAFVRAGIIAASPVMDEIARAGGITATVPFWKDIDATLEPNYSNDDPADLAVPNKIGSGTMSARKAWVNQGFGEMDLVVELAGSDPLNQVRSRFGEYWVRQQQARLIATCVGILAQNVLTYSGDMLIDISGLTGGAELFSSAAFIDAAFTMGDQAENITAIAVHSMVMARMTKNNEIDTIQDSEGKTILRSYKGRVVIVDDGLPVSGTGQNRIYTSILFGRGAFGFGGVEGHAFALGEGVPKTAAELSRTAEGGHGGGMESIWERKTWIMHPFGFTWIEGTLVEKSPTLADLRLAAHWDRVVPRKNIPIAFIKSKA